MNEFQTEAIEHINGPLLVLAGAGSGKTTILTKKVDYLSSIHNIPLEKLLVLTFTNQAVTHFKTELIKVMPDRMSQVWVSTFHELGRKIIQERIYPHFTYVNEYTKRQIIEELILTSLKHIQGEFKLKEKRLVQRFGFRGNESDLFQTMKSELPQEELERFLKMHSLLLEKKKSIENFLRPNVLSQLISKFKSELVLPSSFMRPDSDIFVPYQQSQKINEIIVQHLATDQKKRLFIQIFSKYEITLRERKAVDYEDMMLLPIKLLLTDEHALTHYQDKWSYIMIDEYQDTNQLQYHLIKLISDKSQNLCVVGDDYQTIYRWRGSDYKKIIQFQNDFKDSKIVTLEQNYRNSKSILAAANELIKNNKGQHHKNLFTESTNEEPIYVHESTSFSDEAKWVKDKINELIRKGYHSKEIAILYRHNQDAKLLENELAKTSIPYRISNERSIFDSKDIHYIIRYFSFLNEQTNMFLFQHIIAYFYPSIERKTIHSIAKEVIFHENLLTVIERFIHKYPHHPDRNQLSIFISHVKELLNNMHTLTPKQFYDFFLSLVDMNSISHLHRKEDNEYYSLKSKRMLSHLTKIVSMFEKNHPEKNVLDLFHFLKHGDVQTWFDLHNEEDAVRLMTIHASKGLEFPIVFFIGFQQGIFPSPFTNSMNDLEEERRLCYVAFTRAKDLLLLTYSKETPHYQTKNNGIIKSEENGPSPFLHEFSKDYIKFI